MDQMLVNLKLMDVPPWDEQDLTKLKQYCEAVSVATGVPIAANYPVVGEDAFRTATVVHAARNSFNRCVLLGNGVRRDLPINLVPPGAIATGFGPVIKLAGELFARVLSMANPVS